MSKRAKINSKRIVALRRSPRQLSILTSFGSVIAARANADFDQTASSRDKAIMARYSRSKVAYDVTARTGNDRVRVYVQTANMPARRHERSARGSSLLRALNG